MFDFNRRYSFFRRFVVVIFVIPLMFTGGAFLGDLARQQTIGEVESLDIPRSEYLSRYQSFSERYRRETGEEELSPAVQAAINRRIQSDLLSSYLVFASLEKKGVRAPDEVVAEEIRGAPQFQDEDGDFSLQEYQDAVIDPRSYQERLRRSLGQEPLLRTMNGQPLVALRDELAALRRQKRVVDEVSASVEALTTMTLAVSAEDINFYYQRNADDFALREEAAFEYFVLSLDAFAAVATVSVGAARVAYDAYVEEWGERRRLRVSHIYVADSEEADAIYELVTAESPQATAASTAPDAFAELARERSEDAGSAALGGELGIFAAGDLPEVLDEVATTMRAGQIHPPLETDDGGFSILKLDEIIAEPPPPFSALKEEMERQIRRDEGRDAFELAAEDLRELAPIEIGSLAEMAATVGVSLHVAMSVFATAPAENPPPFNDEDVLVDAFSSPVVEEGENGGPVPFGDDAYIFVRAVQYQPPGRRPLIEVEDSIIGKLRAERTVAEMYEAMLDIPSDADSAAADGEAADAPPQAALFARLGALEWERTHTVILADDEEEELDAPLADGDEAEAAEAADEEVPLDLIYIADLTNGLPAYVFAPLENTVRIFRIREVEEGVVRVEDEEVIGDLVDGMTSQLGFLGYLDELGGQYDFQFYNLPEVEEQPTGPSF